jgi:hypothetical protein
MVKRVHGAKEVENLWARAFALTFVIKSAKCLFIILIYFVATEK